ncbi:unnamed protein product [Durusdinium trenchii]|uniref:Uncharacterized protein n=2 Tax=Durusdinium trenchii TaxID=1381693 RepID=A0ABP0PRA9_9DINO
MALRTSWAIGIFPLFVLLALLVPSASFEESSDLDCLGATSLLQKSVEAGALSTSSWANQPSCMADDLEKMLKGLQESGEQHLNKYLGFPMILLLCASLLIVFMGHKLVPVVVVTSVSLTVFFISFEFLRSTTKTCSVPIWVSLVLAVAAAVVAMCFLEVAVIVPGGVFGAILAYQVQAIVLTASPSLESNVFLTQYFWSIAILAAVIFAYLAHKLKDDIFILLTSVLGAYGFEIALRGVLLDYFSVKMTSLASLISMLAAFLVGLFVQHRSSK